MLFNHSYYEIFRDMGSLIGGLLTLIAGGLAYFAGWQQARATQRAAEMQIEAERNKQVRERETLRRSLAVELRQVIARSYGAHLSLAKLTAQSCGQITARMVESSSSIPVPIVFPATADRVSLLESEATDTLIVYQLVEIARDGAGRLARYDMPNDIPAALVGAVAEAFLQACLYSKGLLPILKTDVEEHRVKDSEMIEKIDEAASAWEKLKQDSLWPYDID